MSWRVYGNDPQEQHGVCEHGNENLEASEGDGEPYWHGLRKHRPGLQVPLLRYHRMLHKKRGRAWV